MVFSARSDRDDNARTWATAVLLCAVYFCAATISLRLSRGLYGFAPIWPANAVLLAAILGRCGHITRYLVAGLIASLAANRLAGGSWLVCAGFTCANIVETLVARRLLRRIVPQGGIATMSGGALVRFSGAAAAAAAISAALATLFASGARSVFFASWFLADFLGLLIVTPITLIVIEGVGRRGGRAGSALPRPPTIEGAALLALVTLVTLAVFLQTTYPLLFVPLAAMTVVVFRLGSVGASVSVLVVAVVASVATALGSGPVALMHAGRLEESFFLQAYLLVLYTAALPTAALLGAQRRLVDELRDNNRLLNLAEAAAQLGHWRYTLADDRIVWSAETFRIHGLEPSDQAPSVDRAIERYVEEERERVAALWAHAVATGDAYEFRSRICRTDGTIRHVLLRGEGDRAPDGSILAIVGMIQDVTEQSEQERALDHARIAAEEAAAAARLASETDPLTGLPNRRQLLMVLERTQQQATEHDQTFSVAILDIDHFKRVNDTFGHAVGDRVLQRIAQAALAALRGTDLIGRFGGEEFIIVLPGAPVDVAETIANRVRAAIEADTIEGPGDRLSVTASLGVAGWRPGEAISALLQRADEALYEAKREGRNRVRCARRRVSAD